MAKGGKLTKLKSVLKKMQSFKLGRANGSSVVVAAANSSSDDESSNNNSYSKDLRPVYVGKSRRRYLVSSDVVEHPLVRELVDRSGDESDDSVTVVGCEVVLFEHLLWMLENADPQPESLDELVDFYAC
ncbi:auxin-responsive protein SAUR76-like [Ipomoea triloba]|uniref:auxin-responsive protein SAUR76-like n=1 Tax=Ipomoea triloba TaxID=35885 RepID=UPI00125D1FE2|nr:auxin-responsive protein SAUR76-like [Ipomoea triloba]